MASQLTINVCPDCDCKEVSSGNVMTCAGVVAYGTEHDPVRMEPCEYVPADQLEELGKGLRAIADMKHKTPCKSRGTCSGAHKAADIATGYLLRGLALPRPRSKPQPSTLQDDILPTPRPPDPEIDACVEATDLRHRLALTERERDACDRASYFWKERAAGWKKEAFRVARYAASQLSATRASGAAAEFDPDYIWPEGELPDERVGWKESDG